RRETVSTIGLGYSATKPLIHSAIRRCTSTQCNGREPGTVHSRGTKRQARPPAAAAQKPKQSPRWPASSTSPRNAPLDTFHPDRRSEHHCSRWIPGAREAIAPAAAGPSISCLPSVEFGQCLPQLQALQRRIYAADSNIPARPLLQLFANGNA